MEGVAGAEGEGAAVRRVGEAGEVTGEEEEDETAEVAPAALEGPEADRTVAGGPDGAG